MSDSPDAPRGSHARHSYRSRHRAESHASAHADAQNQRPQRVLNHPLVPPGAAEVVTSNQGLNQLVGHLREMGSFAYDSEFIGELTYYPRLCLLQVATTKRVALVDPLAEMDLTPLWELFADASVEKIVHAGEQDIEPIGRLIARPCANLFDTQIAAGFAALAYPVSLSKLVLELTGVKLGKGLTFTHWDQRPLSAVQLRYAADDVRYLPLVRDCLGHRLRELNHANWAAEASNSLCDPRRYAFDADCDYLRLRGAGSLSSASLSVLRELMIWRDRMSRAADVPPRAFLRDEILVALARHPPKSLEKLEQVRGLPRPVAKLHGQELVELCLHALKNPLQPAPVHPLEPTPAERFRTDALWALVQTICLGQGIDPNIVVSRQEMLEFERLLRAGTDPSAHPLMRGWRAQAVGGRLMQILHQDRSLTLRWSDGMLRLTDKA